MNKIVTIAILGAGARGRTYASFAKQCPDRLKVVAVAEPNDFYRNFMANEYGIKPENCFKSYEEFITKEKMFANTFFCVYI